MNIMRATIHATNAIDRTKGKATKVESSQISLRCIADREIEIVAGESIQRGTGERGGEFRSYERVVTLRLAKEDLEKVIQCALRNRLVELPGLADLVRAKDELNAALSKLFVEDRSNRNAKEARKSISGSRRKRA
jgi:hypothetical protein